MYGINQKFSIRNKTILHAAIPLKITIQNQNSR